MANTKNIIFDLGGILLNIDYLAPIREFQKLGVNVDANWYAKASQNTLFDDFEIGKISPANFRNEIRKLANASLLDHEIDFAWNSILLDFPKNRMELIQEMSKKYNCFLLSNTNAIHIPAFLEIIKQTYGNDIFTTNFKKCYYSHLMGLRKPNKETFEFVLKENKLEPGETLFIDDSPQHVEGALKSGLNAHWLDVSKTNIVDYLSKKL